MPEENWTIGFKKTDVDGCVTVHFSDVSASDYTDAFLTFISKKLCKRNEIVSVSCDRYIPIE